VSRLSSEQVIIETASAVKELVENSLDSGAKTLNILLADNGLEKIIIQDDGYGMDQEALLLCAQRHTTSKISSYEDISNITSFGFRGEALASLASVCEKFEIVSRPHTASLGYSVTFDKNGDPIQSSLKPVAATKGTKVICTNLFYNTPVRKQFQREEKKGTAKILRVVYEYCLICPQIKVQLRNMQTGDSKKGRDFNKGPLVDHLTVFSFIYGPDVADTLEPVEYEYKDDKSFIWSIYSLVPSYGSDVNHASHGTDQRIFMYINQRPVQLTQIKHIIVNAWRSQGNCGGRYPTVFFHLKIPPDCIDVNLSANKRKVELINSDIIYEHIKQRYQEFYRMTSAVKPTSNDAIIVPIAAPAALDLNNNQSSNTNNQTHVDSQDIGDDESTVISDNEVPQNIPDMNVMSVTDSDPENKQKRKESDTPFTEKKAKKKKKVNNNNDGDDWQSSQVELPAAIDLIKHRMQVSNLEEEIPSQMVVESNDLISKNMVKNLKVIGEIIPSAYVCAFNQKLYFCNHYRIQERLYYQELSESFSPKDDDWVAIDPVVELTAETLFAFLNIDDKKKSSCMDTLNSFAEENDFSFFKANGFNISKNDDNIILTEIFGQIDDYSLNDLVELLYLVSKYGPKK
jgi:DNA mismatch repair protein MutL